MVDNPRQRPCASSKPLLSSRPGACQGCGAAAATGASSASSRVVAPPVWTPTVSITGTPVAAYPAHGPIDIIPGSNAGAIDKDLKTACLQCLDLDRKAVRAYAEKFSWRASAEQFVENLEPYLKKWDQTSDLSDRALELGRDVKNTAYMLPYGFYLRAMFYNKKLLAEAGVSEPPKTMEDFAEASKKVSALPGKYGYCLRGGPGGLNGWVMFGASMAGEIGWPEV